MIRFRLLLSRFYLIYGSQVKSHSFFFRQFAFLFYSRISFLCHRGPVDDISIVVNAIKGFQNNLFLSKLEQTGTSKTKRFSIDGLHVFKLFDNFVTLAYNMRSLRNRQQRTGGNMCPTTVVANQTV